MYPSMRDELEKIALIERLVRLGATPIKGTPKLFMKSRSPAELKALQNSVEQGWAKHVTNPVMNIAEKGISKLPSGRVQSTAREGARLIASDPVGHGLAALVPVPVLPHAGVEVLKKGLERGIDRFFPLPT